MDAALELARMVSTNSPYAMRHTKHLIWAKLDAPRLDAALQLENQAHVMALMTCDFSEAATAFAEARSPRFTGQ